MDTTSSELLGCAPTSSRIGAGPCTISFSSRPSPSTSTATTSPGRTGRLLAGVPGCKFRGRHYSRSACIWVDTDYTMVRGHHQGYPKKLGTIHLTRPVTLGRAGPRLAPGGRFGASLAANDRRLLHATFEIKAESEHAGFVNALPMLHNRWMPAVEGDGSDSLDDLVTISAFESEVGRCFTGNFELWIGNSPVEELTRLQPREPIAGYWRELAMSWRSGTTLKRTNLPEI